jgi:TPR repeat protein
MATLLWWPMMTSAQERCVDDSRCRAQCDKGDNTACVDLGLAMQYTRVDGDPRPLYQKACGRGNEDACYHVEATRDRVQRGDAVEIAAGARKACATGEAKQCTLVGDLIKHGLDTTDTAQFCEKACDRGDAEGCTCAAIATFWNMANSARLAAKACDLGSVGGCIACATLIDPPPDSSFARRMSCADRACKKGSPAACAKKAELLGESVGPVEQVVSLLQTSCDGGIARSCCFLAGRYQDGVGVRKSAARAAEATRRAAKLGSPCGKGKIPAWLKR